MKHTIDTGGAPPIKQAPRRVPLAQKHVMEEEISAMLDQDVIKPSDSPWASPVVLVKKKDGSVRFCIDYRRLNEVSRKDAFPLPRCDECLETLHGASYFSTLDCASGFWQVEMDPKDAYKTSFCTRSGLYEFKVMPYGLCNSPLTFQRLMEGLLRGLQWERALIYIDDVIVMGRSFAETLENLRMVLGRFQDAGLKLKPKKCKLFRSSVNFLGHIVSREGVACDPEKVESITSWPAPLNVSEVRSFLGIAQYYRRFVPGFSAVASPLTALTKANVKFDWTDSCQKAFLHLKELLSTTPVLAHPQPDGVFVLDTDASDTGLGGVLSQVQDGVERVLAYASKSLNKAQRNYCTTKKELLAVVTFVKQYHHYLYGRHFVVRTDHASLTWLRNFKSADGLLARWLSVLETYDFDLKHRKGSQHTNADALSRRPKRRCKREDCPECRTADTICAVRGRRPTGGAQMANVAELSTDGEWLDCWSQAQIEEWQQQDSDIRLVMQWLEQSTDRPEWKEVAPLSSELKAYWTQWGKLEVRGGLLYREYTAADGCRQPVWQLVAPRTLRQEILAALHGSRVSGHLGVSRTVDGVRRRYYWPGYKRDVALWCRQCDTCAQKKSGPPRKKAPLCQELAGGPLQRVAMDIVGPLPRTSKGNAYILVIGDYFTKWVESYAIPDHTARTVADCFVEEFVCRYGVPARVHTDQGSDFTSHLFSHVCELLEIKKTKTAPYRPCSDGFVERANRTIQQMLSVLVNEARDNWDDHLPYVMMAYRATAQESTKLSPNRLMLGREVALPLDIMMGPPPEAGPECPVEYVEWVKAASMQAFDLARANLKVSAERQKRNYDADAGLPSFKVGNWVWHYYPPKAKEKLGKPWRGPFLITEKVSDVNVRVQASPTARSQVVHVDSLKLYEGCQAPQSWLSPLVVDTGIHESLSEEAEHQAPEDAWEDEDQATVDEAESLPEDPLTDPLIPVPSVEDPEAELAVPLATRRSTRTRKPLDRLDL